MLRVEATGRAGGDYSEVEDGGEVALDLWVIDHQGLVFSRLWRTCGVSRLGGQEK